MYMDPFQALADPVRRQIVLALAAGETPAGAIAAQLPIRQSGVSRHLRILGEAGFVTVRADGARRLYSLRREPFRDLDAWLAPFRDLWEARLDRFEVALAERQAAGGARPSAEPGRPGGPGGGRA